MSTPAPKVVYDPQYNFHPGVHGELVRGPYSRIALHEGKLRCWLEPCIRARPGSWLSRQTLCVGHMRGRGDILFSPHILLVTSRPWLIEVEHALWFYTDHYGQPVDKVVQSSQRATVTRKILERDSCRRILAMSEEGKRSMDRAFPDSEPIQRKLVVCPPFVHVPPWRRAPREGPPRLLFVVASGRDFVRKGGDIAIEIFRQVRAAGHDVELWIVGPVADEDLAVARGPGVRAFGAVSRPELLGSVMPEADILLFPSRADTFGFVVLEAMSRGLVPIASAGPHVFGTMDLIQDGVSGFLVNHCDATETNLLAADVSVDGFVRRTLWLLERPEERGRMQQAAYHRVARSPFDASSGIPRFEDVVTDSLQPRDERQ